MKFYTLIFMHVFLLGLFCISSIANSALPKDPFLGIPPQDENYYKTKSDTIKCKDGSKKFTKAQLNDDFCDCPDGTDEPGTSACPNGKFYCRNSGHVPLLIFSSRVNDGICDCCDGSDEYDGKITCQNTCWEAGKVARDKLHKKIATYKEGIGLRKREIENAKVAFAKDEAELAKLRSEENVLKGLVQQLKERKEQIEREEEKERLQKEKEEKEKREAEEKSNTDKSKVEEESKNEKGKTVEKATVDDEPVESANDDEIGVLDDYPLDQDDGKDSADHMTEAGQEATSPKEGSPANGVEQDDAKDSADHMAKVEQDATSRKEGSPANGVEQHAETKEESASPKSNDDSAFGSETVQSVGSEGSDVSKNTEGLSKEELGHLVASRWTGNSESSAGGGNVVKDNDHKEHEDHEGHEDHEDHEGHEEMPADSPDEEYDGYASETDDDTDKYDDIDAEDDIDETYGDDAHYDASSSYKPDPEDEFDFSDTTSPSNPSLLEKIQKTVRSIIQAVNFFQTPVNKSEAAHVRKEYEESSNKLSKIKSRISSLTQKLKHNFGTEKEFYSFYDNCFESKENKYVYKVCPFKQASQVEGHTTTRLGRWDKFEDSYRTMIFSNGDKCWNGPDRSLTVKLRCGLKNEIADVDEPSRCDYSAILSTPALCLEEKLKELDDKLESMNKGQPERHDEL